MAASQGLTAKIGGKTTGQKLAILGGILAVIGLLYYQFFASPSREELGKQEKKFKTLKAENDQLKQREKEWQKLVKEKEQIDKELEKNRESLPSEADLNSFIGTLQRQAAAAGVSFIGRSSEGEEEVGPYTKVPVRVTVSGTYFQVMKYFKLLAETKRITTVENFALEPAKDRNRLLDEGILVAKFRAATFRQTEPTVQDTPTEQTPAKPADTRPSNPIVDKAVEHKELKEKRLEGATGITGDDEEQPADGAGGGDKTGAGVDRLKSPGAP